MFTLKVNAGGDISLRSEKSLQIAKAGSSGFKNIINQLQGDAAPDYIVNVPGIYADTECKDALQEEERVISPRNDGVNISDCIVIIITESESLIRPDIKEYNGSLYEFIYRGDEAYITDANGHTVEVVR